MIELLALIFIINGVITYEAVQNVKPEEQKIILKYCCSFAQKELPNGPDEGRYPPIKCPAITLGRLGVRQRLTPTVNGHWYSSVEKDSQPIQLPSPAGDASDAAWIDPSNGPIESCMNPGTMN